VKLQRDRRNSSKVKFIQQKVISFETVVLLLTLFLFFLVIVLVIGLVFLSEDGFFEQQELSIIFVSEAIE